MTEPLGTSVAVLPPSQALGTRDVHTFPWPATWILLLSFSALLSSMLVLGLHTPRGFFLPVLTIAICILAALLDACTRRIPNHLTYGAILAGLAINALASASVLSPKASSLHAWLAAPGLTQSLLGFGVCAALGLLGAFARIGGGDIKLLAALGALMGLADIGSVLLVALVIAVVYALLNLALSGRLNKVVHLLAIRALELFYFRRFDPIIESDDRPESKRHDMIPMAVPLALGLIIAQAIDIKAHLGIAS